MTEGCNQPKGPAFQYPLKHSLNIAFLEPLTQVTFMRRTKFEFCRQVTLVQGVEPDKFKALGQNVKRF